MPNTITLTIPEVQELAEFVGTTALIRKLMRALKGQAPRGKKQVGFDNTQFAELLWQIHSLRVKNWYCAMTYHERSALRRTPPWLSP